jgi:hypothetical protein
VKKAFLLSLAFLLAFQVVEAKKRPKFVASSPSDVKARNLTGTYRSRSGEFKVQGLGVNRLHVQFNGTYTYKVNKELMANTGTGDGMTTLKGNVAEFVPTDTQGCSINLKFVGNKLIATQTGSDADCGFGHNVVADGTYIRRSSRPPNFDQP